MQELEYPFDSEFLLKKSKSLKKALLSDGTGRIEKKIAVLGGSTTHDIVRILELFLLNHGIVPVFYESEYAQYWQDAMFPGEELRNFHPDVIFVHTSNRNVTVFPAVSDTEEAVQELLQSTYRHFEVMWEKLREDYACPIIQNNFEYPFYRVLGNKEAVDVHGRIFFLNRLNDMFYQYARTHENFFIHDIQYLSARYGLDKWADPFYWHMYKYSLCLQAIPTFCHSVANIIKSLYGKNKKALVLDLDNTLWGGIVGDDGPENIEIGQETSMGQVFSEFQDYIKSQKEIGVLLTISSKNEEENALAGLSRPDSKLTPEDFLIRKVNWEPKSKNVAEIAEELNVLPDSLVFVDDNPAERAIVKDKVQGVSVPEIGTPEQYIRIIDHAGFFEVTNLSEDDKSRNAMYKANMERQKQEERFDNYGDYLKSLQMVGTIKAFEPMYMARIAQLTNKSNQFNLTTKRMSQADIERIAGNPAYMTQYGKLEDKFGDNGVVSVVIGRKDGDTLHIELWLMSCRVLKRDMEYAMMDTLVHRAIREGIKNIKGYYYPTAKNKMVEHFYELQGFLLESRDEQGNAVYCLSIDRDYQNKNQVIRIVS